MTKGILTCESNWTIFFGTNRYTNSSHNIAKNKTRYLEIKTGTITKRSAYKSKKRFRRKYKI